MSKCNRCTRLLDSEEKGICFRCVWWWSKTDSTEKTNYVDCELCNHIYHHEHITNCELCKHHYCTNCSTKLCMNIYCSKNK
jgi:hypothetical protein